MGDSHESQNVALVKIVPGILAAVVSAIALLVAFGAVKWYVWDIVIGQADAADRSMLFLGSTNSVSGHCRPGCFDRLGSRSETTTCVELVAR